MIQESPNPPTFTEERDIVLIKQLCQSFYVNQFWYRYKD